MNVADKTVVLFKYKMTDGTGELISDSGDEALAILHGSGGVLPALEKAMLDKAPGDQFIVTLTPEEGYGEYKNDAEQRVPSKYIATPQPWQKGDIVEIKHEEGYRLVTIKKMGKFMVTVDTNHPMAGKTLNFNMTITDVREATPEEIEHNHAHAGGHHHH